MEITWLGQAGLLFDNGTCKVVVDPYLSDSVAKTNPANTRKVPVEDRFLGISPDVLIFTHDHLDHYDPETAEVYLQEDKKRKTVLCPASVWTKARALGGPHNYIQFNKGTEWTEGTLRFSAVRAEHSDPLAVGVVLEDLAENRVYYITGDTLYNREIFDDLPERIDVIFLPVNGVGCNMNMVDAERFCRRINPGVAVPFHCGMLDCLDLNDFGYEPKVVPQIYKKIEV